MTIAQTKIVKLLSGPKPVFYLLPLLMIILVIGTVAQRYIGLNAAENLFFGAWVLWIGPVPVPATVSLLGVISTCLMVKVIFKTRWVWAQAGIILTHIGVLVLLLGGLLTFIDSQEGSITLSKGQKTNAMADYHQREMVVLSGGNLVQRVSAEMLTAGFKIGDVNSPFAIEVKESCRNCIPEFRQGEGQYRGLAEKLMLKELPLKKEDEANIGGVTFQLSGAGDEQDGEYIVYEAIPRYPEFSVADKDYQVRFVKEQHGLPFTVRLDAFRKFTYPSSTMASEYESKVTIIEKSGLQWQQAIRMNEPLRTQGYTLYQSSFIEDINGNQLSVLAVVKNKGAIFPYIASIIMAIGLIWHVIIRRRKVAL